MGTLSRIAKQLASLTQINSNFVSYAANSNNNDVYAEPLDFVDYEDTRAPQNIIDVNTKTNRHVGVCLAPAT